MRIPYNITVNLDKPGSFTNIILKQGDEKSRRFIFHLISNGKVFDAQNAFSCSLKVTKPDETFIFDTLERHENLFYYDVIPQMTVVEGESICELELIGFEGEVLHSFSIFITVIKNTFDEEKLLSESDLRGFKTYMTHTHKMYQATQEIKTAFDLKYGSIEEIESELANLKENYVVYFEDIRKKALNGYFNGEQGPQGPSGADAILSEVHGIIGFQIIDGELLCYYYDDDIPPFLIDDDGNLIYELGGTDE